MARTKRAFQEASLGSPQARATFVLDENVSALEPALDRRNFVVVVPERGEADDQIARRLLSHRIFITRNPRDFVYEAPVYSFGIISLEKIRFIDPDPTDRNQTAALISRAFIAFDLAARRGAWILTLHRDGRHAFRFIEGGQSPRPLPWNRRRA